MYDLSGLEASGKVYFLGLTGCEKGKLNKTFMFPGRRKPGAKMESGQSPVRQPAAVGEEFSPLCH